MDAAALWPTERRLLLRAIEQHRFRNQSPVYNSQSNTFGINFKQIFQAGNNFAGLNIAGVSSDPNSANLQPGDLWFNTGSNHLNFRDGSGNTKALASPATRPVVTAPASRI
jgi:hypothetical protein